MKEIKWLKYSKISIFLNKIKERGGKKRKKKRKIALLI
jgi:hypothetical protein